MTRGEIHRMDSRSFESTDDGLKDAWRRSQDHLENFSKLIALELEDELSSIQERWKKWPKKRLIASGVALFELEGRSSGRFFGEPVLAFKRRDGDFLPQHRFSNGDIVVISRSKPWGEKVIEGIVLDRNRKRVRVVVKEKPKDLRKGFWRLDRGANRVAHDRMQNALLSLHSTEGDFGTPLRDLLLGGVHDIAASATMKPEISGVKTKGVDFSLLTLNDSQKKALETSISQRLSLIQGPPGCGKTHTAVQIIKCLVQNGHGPILACAESNVAVDNLLEGLLGIGVRALRIGKPVKVREELRNATLDSRCAEHPKREEVEFILQETEDIRKKLPSLKGKDKGMAHRDMQRNWREVRAIEDDIVDSVMEAAEVICATNIGSGHKILESKQFPIVLMDEASQATEPSSFVPIVRGARQLIMVGDHKQLPPTVISKRAQKGGLTKSLFERLINLGIPTQMLTTQYRMHPVIREFPSERFYDGKLNDGCSREDRPAPAGFIWPDWDAPVAMIPVEGSEESDEEGSSKANRSEAAMVLKVVNELLVPGDMQSNEIGIITPYNGQVRMLDDLFHESGGRGPKDRYPGLEIKSVDGYQGREKEVIVFSAVRANEEGEVGFLSDKRRLNVAITRAKRGLVIIGHPKTLRQNSTWASWLDWSQERGLHAWHLVND